jgi:putative exporter of polyketide antibiotics
VFRADTDLWKSLATVAISSTIAGIVLLFVVRRPFGAGFREAREAASL